MSTLNRPRGRRSALIAVGLQQDLISGSRQVTTGDVRVVQDAFNSLRDRLQWDQVVFTQLQHPADHVSFVSTQLARGLDAKLDDPATLANGCGYKLVVSHCVEGTDGANFTSEENLTREVSDLVINVGTNAGVPSFSAFRDLQPELSGLAMTTLAKDLKSANVTDVYVLGLGLEEMVTQTALDAKALGFSAHVVVDASLGWSAAAGQSSKLQLEANGVKLLDSRTLLSDNIDRRTDSVNYIESNNIHVIFQKLTAALVYHKPANPKEFLIQEIQKLQKQRTSDQSRLSLLSDSDLATMFSMLDPVGAGSLSGKQVMQGLTGLGLKPKAAVEPTSSFDVEKFKEVVLASS
jgi:nicotinamidase/pyrazinamidase